MVVYSCSKSSGDGVPQLGDFLSLGGVALDGIVDSGFGSAPTGALAAQRRAWWCRNLWSRFEARVLSCCGDSGSRDLLCWKVGDSAI
jgi:hypothetical protein